MNTLTELTLQKIQHLKELDEQVKAIDNYLEELAFVHANYSDYHVVGFFNNHPTLSPTQIKIPLSLTLEFAQKITDHYTKERTRILTEAAEMMK